MTAKGLGTTTATLVALSLPTAGLADWQYTQWGMSPEEVYAAAQGETDRALLLTEEDDDLFFGSRFGFPGVIAETQYPRYDAGIAFLFTEERLSGVLLTIETTTPNARVFDLLVQRYGAPIIEPQDPDSIEATWIWRDTAQGNIVHLDGEQNSSSGQVYYTPILTAEQSSL